MTPAERSIRMRTDLAILAPGDRGYQDWADRRELLRIIDALRGAPETPAAPAAGQGGGGADDPPPARPSGGRS